MKISARRPMRRLWSLGAVFALSASVGSATSAGLDPLSVSGTLSAQGSFVEFLPLSVSGALSAVGQFAVLQPLSISGTLAAHGDFDVASAPVGGRPPARQQ